MNKTDENVVVVTGLAAISSVGLTLEQTCASVRAGICRFEEHVYYDSLTEDPEWDEEVPLLASIVPTIDPFLPAPDRLYELTVPALRELIKFSGIKRKDIASAGLYLALPQRDRAVDEWRLPEKFLPELYRQTSLDGFKTAKINQLGHSGGAVLLSEAISLLMSGQLSFCIVGGVDSYFSDERVEMLDKDHRLRSVRNIDGFIPGEGASMVLLETAAQAKRRKAKILATVLKVSQGKEAQTIYTDKSSSGNGLASALRGLQNGNTESTFQWVLSDLNGESYRSGEWGIVNTRLAQSFGEIKKFQHPADCYGDIGAATSGMLMACACHAFTHKYNPANEVALWTSSDEGTRAAVLIGQPGNGPSVLA